MHGWRRTPVIAVPTCVRAPASMPWKTRSSMHSAARASENDNVVEMPRRKFWWAVPVAVGGTALAASVAAVIMIGTLTLPSLKPSVVASNRIVNLKDGSVVTLEQDGKIDFAMADGIRKVTLLTGKARFKVAHDKGHPFVVQSGDVYAQATGTVYSVSRHGPNGGAVRVTEGSVLVWQHDHRDQAILLRPGEGVTLDPMPVAPEPAATPKASTPPALPLPIKDAVARFNRTQMVIKNPAIGEATIVGLYRADDPEQFAQAIATVSGRKIER